MKFLLYKDGLRVPLCPVLSTVRVPAPDVSLSLDRPLIGSVKLFIPRQNCKMFTKRLDYSMMSFSHTRLFRPIDFWPIQK